MTLQTYLTLIQWNIEGILKNVVTNSFDIPLIYKKNIYKNVFSKSAQFFDVTGG